jgi:hypothetical protein
VALGLLGLALIVAGGWHGSSVAGVSAPPSTTVLVATRALEVGTVVAPPDVSALSVPAAGALAGLAHSLGEVLARRVVLAVPSGTLLQAAMLTAGPPVATGHRLARLTMDAASLAGDIAAGIDVDVLAAMSSSDAADGGGRVVTVATARVVGLSTSGPSSTLTLDCDASAASRVLWAQTFAKAVRVLAHPSGGGPGLSEVNGLAASR